LETTNFALFNNLKNDNFEDNSSHFVIIDREMPKVDYFGPNSRLKADFRGETVDKNKKEGDKYAECIILRSARQ